MIPHPLDLRTIRPGATTASTPGAKTPPDLTGDEALPGLTELLTRPPAERLSPDLPRDVLVVDAIAYRVVNHLYQPNDLQTRATDKKRTLALQSLEPAMAWFDGAGIETRRRMMISFAQHLYQQELTVLVSGLASGRDIRKEEIIPELANQVREHLLGCWDAVPVLPTVDRVSNVDNRLGPEQVRSLRSMNWRDAAGRDIDSCLFLGALTAHGRASLPIQDPSESARFAVCYCVHDEDKGTHIDKVFRTSAYTLKGLLQLKGLILTTGHREWLREIQSQPSSNLDAHLPLLTQPSEKIGADYIQELLDLDRTNRLMHQTPPAPHQGPATTPEVEPPQLTL